MDVLDELKDLQRQKQVQTDNHRLTFEEYNDIVNNRLKRVNAELYLLLNELIQHEQVQDRINNLNNILNDFQMYKINDLQEQLKDAFY